MTTKGKETLTLYVTPKQRRRVEAIAARQHQFLSAVAAEAIDIYLDVVEDLDARGELEELLI